MNWIKSLWLEEQGQDLIEYTLLLGFVALAAAALLLPISDNLIVIWSSGSTTVAGAAGRVP
jgi:Flp pilus assembly pilin Flp